MERGGDGSGSGSSCSPEAETSLDLDSPNLPHLSQQATIEAVSIEITPEVGAALVGVQLHTITMETSGDHPGSRVKVSMLCYVAV